MSGMTIMQKLEDMRGQYLDESGNDLLMGGLDSYIHPEKVVAIAEKYNWAKHKSFHIDDEAMLAEVKKHLEGDRMVAVVAWTKEERVDIYLEPLDDLEAKSETISRSPIKLRGEFILPDLKEKGMERRFGRGYINNIIPFDEELALVCATGGAALFDLRNNKVQFEIDCPAASGALSPDGVLLALGGVNNIFLWDLRRGNLLRRLEYEGIVRSLAFTPDGKILVSGSPFFKSMTTFWDVATGRSIRQLDNLAAGAWSIAVSPDGRLLVVATSYKVFLFEIDTGRLKMQRFEHENARCVAFSPDCFLFAVGGNYKDSSIRLCETATGREIRRFEGHTDDVRSIIFSSNGKLLASGSDDKSVMLWDVRTGRVLQHLKGHVGKVSCVAFSPNEKLLLSGSHDATVRLWDVATGREKKRLTEHTNSSRSVAFSPDGKILASVGDDNCVRLWEFTSGREKQKLDGHTELVSCVVFSPDGRYLASGGNDRFVKLFDTATGQEVRRLEGRPERNLIREDSIVFSPDGLLLASLGEGKTSVLVWEVSTGREISRLEGHTGITTSVAFSPDGQLLASAGGDKTVRLWEVVTGKEIRQLQGHVKSVNSVAFSPDGQLLASGSEDESIRLWEVATGREIQQFTGGIVTSVAFSPDGQVLALAAPNSVRLWDIKTRYELRRLERDTVWGISHIEFSPDGQFLVSANYDAVRLWNVSKIPESRILIQPTRQPEIRAQVKSPEVKKAPPPIPAFDEEKPSKSRKYVYALIGVAMIGFLLFAIFPKREATTPTNIPKVVLGIINTKGANIRSAPSPNSAVISKAQLGDTVVVVSESSEWLFVKYKNKEGYISAKLVKQ